MIVQIKEGRKTIEVRVSSEECPKYECFSPHKYEHKNITIDKEVNSWFDDYFSCSYRNYNGCPDNPKMKEK